MDTFVCRNDDLPPSGYTTETNVKIKKKKFTVWGYNERMPVDVFWLLKINIGRPAFNRAAK